MTMSPESSPILIRTVVLYPGCRRGSRRISETQCLKINQKTTAGPFDLLQELRQLAFSSAEIHSQFLFSHKVSASEVLLSNGSETLKQESTALNFAD